MSFDGNQKRYFLGARLLDQGSNEQIRALTAAEAGGLSGEPFAKVIPGDIARFGQR